MKKVKPYIFVLGILLLIFGFFGFFLSLPFPNKIERFTDVKTINDRNGMVVDSFGNIYIGDLQKNTIQVFSKTGSFLYGFTINTSGTYNFGIDEDDNIHVVTIRNNKHLIFESGFLVNEENIDYEQIMELEKKYKMPDGSLVTNYTTGSQYIRDSKKYRFTLGKNIEVTDLETKTTTTIKLNIPWWPLSIFSFWLTAAIGMILCLITYGFRLLKDIRKTYRYSKSGV